MKCPICGKEFSRTVYKLHVKRCKKPEQPSKGAVGMTEEEIRALAKEQGVKSWHVKKLDNIIAELNELGVM